MKEGNHGSALGERPLSSPGDKAPDVEGGMAPSPQKRAGIIPQNGRQQRLLSGPALGKASESSKLD